MPKGLIPILIVILVVGGYFIFTSFSKNTTSPSNSNLPVIQPYPTTEAATADWKSYINAELGYAIKYPADWTITNTGYLNSTQITNSNQTVTITISEGQYPYDYGGDAKFDTRDIKVAVGDKEYTAKENIVNDKDAFVDFKLDSPRNHHILFGTGYPAGCCGKTSLSDYKSSFDTILKILSTFKFTQ